MKKRVLAAFLSMAMVAGLATGCGTPGGGKSDGDSADGKVFRYAVNTLPTTLEPTKNTVSRVAREMNRHVELVDGLVDAFGADQDKFKALLCGKAAEIADQVDVILLAQGSMAYAEDAIHEKIGKPVLSSPRSGAQALAAALKAKGL